MARMVGSPDGPVALVIEPPGHVRHEQTDRDEVVGFRAARELLTGQWFVALARCAGAKRIPFRVAAADVVPACIYRASRHCAP